VPVSGLRLPAARPARSRSAVSVSPRPMGQSEPLDSVRPEGSMAERDAADGSALRVRQGGGELQEARRVRRILRSSGISPGGVGALCSKGRPHARRSRPTMSGARGSPGRWR